MGNGFPEDEVRRLYEGGTSIEKITNALGLDRKKVSRFIIENSITGPTRIPKTRYGEPQPADLLTARRLSREGKTYREIARVMGVSDHRVTRLMAYNPLVDHVATTTEKRIGPNLYQGMFPAPTMARLMSGR